MRKWGIVKKKIQQICNIPPFGKKWQNVDQNNWFFKKLFVGDNKTFLKSIHCDDFLTTKKEKAKHNFLKHYDAGKEIPFEEKPLYIIQLPALTIYKIEF